MTFNSEFEKYAVKHRGMSSNTLNSYASQLVTAMTPNIIEERSMNVAVMDVYSRLMMDRIIFLGYPINDEVANIVTAQLLFLDSTDRSRDINMYINSPGGSVYSGLGVYDTMQYIKPKVATLCIGQAASMGSLLLTAGAEGMRYATPNARIMIHQPSGGFRGQASDIEIHAAEIIALRLRLNNMYVKHTGQKLPVIEKAMDRDNFMSAEMAQKFGLIDEIVTNRGEAEKKVKK